jgi:hypothetical protein
MKKNPWCPKRKLCLGFATGCGAKNVRCPLKNAFLGSCHFTAYLEDELKAFKKHARAIEREPVKKWVSAAAKASVVASNAHVEMWMTETLRVAVDMMVNGNHKETTK